MSSPGDPGDNWFGTMLLPYHKPHNFCFFSLLSPSCNKAQAPATKCLLINAGLCIDEFLSISVTLHYRAVQFFLYEH